MRQLPGLSIVVRLVLIAVVVVVAGCGAADHAELTVVDDQSEIEGNTAPGEPETSDESTIALDAIEDDSDGQDVFGPIPVAELPAAPAPESSPAERQRLQELGLDPATVAPLAPVPIPARVDEADSRLRASSGEVTRSDLDQFPDTIPLTERPAADPVDSAAASTPDQIPEYADTPPEGSASADLDEAFEIYSELEEDLEADADSDSRDGAGAAALDLSEPPSDFVPETDVAVREDSDESPAGESAEGTADGTVPGDPVPVDCDLEPWERGCVAPIEPDAFGSIFDDGDELSESNDDDSTSDEGVDVPQDVVDLLLTPGDNELGG